ncbi:MAG: hypothetical protein ACJ8LL_07220 [Candidatus Udaeobacter sp.]
MNLLAVPMQAARPTITVDGMFVDAATGRGIPNARVELRQRHWGFPLDPAETPLAIATTNRHGYFRFSGQWRGRFRLWCYGRDHKMGIREISGEHHGLRIAGD